MKIFKAAVIAIGIAWSPLVLAQWAVSDADALEQLKRINKVDAPTNKPADAVLQGQGQELLLSSSHAFHQLQIAVSEKEKYILGEASCGVKSVNENYFNACIGRRNLAINSLQQYDIHLTKMKTHLDAIQKLLNDSRGVSEESGQIQRYHLEITGRQALMSGEASRMQTLMQAYKQRDELYALQMAESREGALNKPPVNTETGASTGVARAPTLGKVWQFKKPAF